ncbi:hypothetical protein C8R45DRAFT_923393 [Mycena sanguinolenta]|nr:hypothetical protein C8R45DRAFT_923393 [Mycena sanguinolenta]
MPVNGNWHSIRKAALKDYGNIRTIHLTIMINGPWSNVSPWICTLASEREHHRYTWTACPNTSVIKSRHYGWFAARNSGGLVTILGTNAGWQRIFGFSIVAWPFYNLTVRSWAYSSLSIIAATKLRSYLLEWYPFSTLALEAYKYQWPIRTTNITIPVNKSREYVLQWCSGDDLIRFLRFVPSVACTGLPEYLKYTRTTSTIILANKSLKCMPWWFRDRSACTTPVIATKKFGTLARQLFALSMFFSFVNRELVPKRHAAFVPCAKAGPLEEKAKKKKLHAAFCTIKKRHAAWAQAL